MIYTVTFNPAIDYIVHLDHLQPGGLNRSNATATFAGGKGINVSRVLNRLGAETTALGFLGGFTGEFIKKELDRDGIAHHFIQVAEDTRINVKIKAEEETEINGQGPVINREAREEFARCIERLLPGDILLLAGSALSSLPLEFYQTILTMASDRGAKTVVDTSGPLLGLLAGQKPFLMKPNHHELGELFGEKVKSIDQAAEMAKRLTGLGVKNVIVSMAAEGALFVNADVVLFAAPPKGQVVNSVGAGDSMVAGFLAGYSAGESREAAFRYSVAAGSATAFSEDLCTRDAVEKLLPDVKVERIV